MRQLVYTMFISNNRASFHLWWNRNLLKHQKVSKYYESSYSYREKGNPLFAFNVIKLVLLYFCLLLDFFYIFWNCILSKISGFLFIATVKGCFLLFFYKSQTHRAGIFHIFSYSNCYFLCTANKLVVFVYL